MPVAVDVPAVQYDPQTISALVREELEDFHSHLFEEIFTIEQEMRGALIAWFCFFTPKLISKDCKLLLFAIREEIHSRSDYSYSGWFRTLPLEVALYGISPTPGWLQVHKANFDHHKASLRCYVMDTLSLVASQLSIDDQELIPRVAHNLNVSHAGCEWGAAMMAIAQGERENKIKLFQEWAQNFGHNPHEKQLLDDLAAGRMVRNGYFLSVHLRTAAYICHRLCTPRRIGTDISDLQEELFSTSIWEQIQRHPLMDPFIKISE